MNIRRGLGRAAGVLILAGAICACSKTPGETASASPARAPEDNFGPAFGSAFRADPNSVPMVPTRAAVAPVNPTAQPVPVR